jgi:hypothetical protein
MQQTEMHGGEAAHRQADNVGTPDPQPVKHRQRVGDGDRLGILLHIGRICRMGRSRARRR